MSAARERQPGNDRCPRYALWTAGVPSAEKRWNSLRPFSWQGGYVACYDGRGRDNWSLLTYEEFWDWADNAGAKISQDIGR